MKHWTIWDHMAYPGPDYWDFKCLDCNEAVKEHAPWPLVLLRKMYDRIMK